MSVLPHLASAFLHRLDPFVIRFTGNLGIRWYGVAYLAGFFIAWLLLRWLARTGRCRLSGDAVSSFLTHAVLGVLVGGRLGYVLFYEQHLLWDPPLLGIVQIWRGGMSSHGGFLGVALGVWLFCRKYHIPVLHVLDLSVLVCPPGLGLGRLANFVNAELWGKPLPASWQADPPWWSVKYPEEILQAGFSHRDTVLALKARFGIDGPFPGAVVEAVRAGHEQLAEALRPLLTAYYPSQLFQAVTDGPLLFAIMAILWRVCRKPGCVSGGFLVSYGVFRIMTEVFRQPDPGVAALATPFGDLSRGQVLSAAMVAAGIVMAAVCARRKTNGT
jgi:phosphatidylglycerol:prolipoprotein diacylglycerol transferase